MKDKVYKVYRVTNSINNKVYIGITEQLFKFRKNDHIQKAFRYNSPSYFHCALRKYGREVFKWEIIDESAKDYEELNLLEKLYIEDCKSKGFELYNLTDGGGGISGHTFTATRSYPTGENHHMYARVEMTCKQCGQIKLVTPWHKDHNQFCSKQCSYEYRKGKEGHKHSEKTKSLISQIQLGTIRKPHSEETKNRISESNIGKHYSKKEIKSKTCLICNKEFTKRSQSDTDKSQYCSRECADNSRIGKSWGSHSEEHKKQMSDKYKGEGNPMYGKEANEAQKKGLSVQRGESHHKAKLTSVQVQEIRLLFDCVGITCSQLTKMYNISKHIVSKITNHITWKEVL